MRCIRVMGWVVMMGAMLSWSSLDVLAAGHEAGAAGQGEHRAVEAAPAHEAGDKKHDQAKDGNQHEKAGHVHEVEMHKPVMRMLHGR